jgi:hypothetical protein
MASELHNELDPIGTIIIAIFIGPLTFPIKKEIMQKIFYSLILFVDACLYFHSGLFVNIHVFKIVIINRSSILNFMTSFMFCQSINHAIRISESQIHELGNFISDSIA